MEPDSPVYMIADRLHPPCVSACLHGFKVNGPSIKTIEQHERLQGKASAKDRLSAKQIGR